MAVFYPHVWPPCRTAASYCLTSCPRPMMVYELKFQAQYNLQLGKKKTKKTTNEEDESKGDFNSKRGL